MLLAKAAVGNVSQMPISPQQWAKRKRNARGNSKVPPKDTARERTGR